MSISNQKKQLLIILSVIFLANLLFRWFTLTDCGIWYDEAYSVFYSQKDLQGIKMVSTWDIAPPFYNYVLHFWMSVFGISENAVRMMSVVFISLAAVLLYWLAFRHFGMETAILSSVLFFFHNEVFYYAQEARTYALLSFFALASTFCFFELLRNPKWYWIPIIGAINWAAVYSQYVFIVIPAIQFGIAIISLNRKVIAYFFASSIISVLIFGKWLNRIRDVITQGGNSTISVSIHLSDLLQMFYRLMNGPLLFYFLLILSLAGIIFYVRTIRRRVDYSELLKILYLFIWAAGPVIATFISRSGASTFIPRYLFFTVPAFCLSAGFFVNQIPFPRWVKYAILPAVAIAGILNINFRIQKGTDYKNAEAYIKNHQTDSTLIIIQTTAMGPLFSYYYDKKIFSTKDSFEIKLFRKHVILKEDSTTMHPEILTCFSSVILAQTFQQFNDPEGTLFSLLKRRFKNSRTNNQFTDVLVTEFDDPTFKNAMTESERASCFTAAYKKNFLDPRVEYYRNKIMGDPGWLNSVKEKARQQNVPLDTMIERDALYMISHE